MRKTTILLLVTLFTLPIVYAQRGPREITLSDYVAGCKKIAIARFTGYQEADHPLTSPYKFTIEQPLKGIFEKTEVFLEHNRGYIRGPFNMGDPCIVFINDGSMWMENQFEYVDMIGAYKEGKTGKDQIIYIEDFYDSTNVRSHWDMESVYKGMKKTKPGSLTEGQLRNYLSKGKYESHAKGYLYFFSTQTQKMEPSALEIKIDVVYTQKEPNYIVTSSFNINDFTAQPQMNVFDFGYIGELVYNSEGTRPLKIAYQFLQADSSGENIEAKFWIEEPEEITEKEFLDYLSHPSYGPPYFELELETAKHSKYTLMRWDRLRAFDMELIGFMNQTFNDTRMSPPNTEGGELEMKFGDDVIIIQFKPRPEKKEQYPFIQDHFIREVKIAPIEATITWQNKGATRDFGSCTIYYKKTGFAANPNYRGK